MYIKFTFVVTRKTMGDIRFHSYLHWFAAVIELCLSISLSVCTKTKRKPMQHNPNNLILIQFAWLSWQIYTNMIVSDSESDNIDLCHHGWITHKGDPWTEIEIHGDSTWKRDVSIVLYHLHIEFVYDLKASGTRSCTVAFSVRSQCFKNLHKRHLFCSDSGKIMSLRMELPSY